MLFAPCVRAFCALAVRRRHGARGARQLHRVYTRMTACGACFSFNLIVSLYLSVFSRICCSCLIARRPEQSALRAATVGGVETLATRRALTLLRCPSSVPRLIYTVCLLVRGAFFFRSAHAGACSLDRTPRWCTVRDGRAGRARIYILSARYARGRSTYSY